MHPHLLLAHEVLICLNALLCLAVSVLNVFVMLLAPVSKPPTCLVCQLTNQLPPLAAGALSFHANVSHGHNNCCPETTSSCRPALLNTHNAVHAEDLDLTDARLDAHRPLRVVHSALCTRVLLNLRRAAADSTSNGDAQNDSSGGVATTKLASLAFASAMCDPLEDGVSS